MHTCQYWNCSWSIATYRIFLQVHKNSCQAETKANKNWEKAGPDFLTVKLARKIATQME
jgi:hypothetical protein